MASVNEAAGPQLEKRVYYYCEDGSDCSNWYYWGRWVFAALVVVFIFGVFVAWSCFSSRHRRSRGIQPVYGTGWATGPPKYPGPPPIYTAAAPPPPNPHHPHHVYYPTGSSFATTTPGYYGPNEGIQMTPQPPPNTYQPAAAAAAAAYIPAAENNTTAAENNKSRAA